MISVIRNRESRDLRIEEAAQWFVELRSTDMSADDLKRWNDWSKIEANQRAFDAIARRWQSAEALEGMPLPTSAELDADDYDGSMPVSAQLTRGARSIAHGRSHFTAPRRGVMKRLAIAAAVVAFFVSGVWLKEEFPDRFTGSQIEVHETAAMQHRKVELADGSLIDLGAKTSVSVSYAPDRRTIVLDHGEALFHVTHDPQRPFVVVAGRGAITAVGTAFNVRRDEDRVVVSVTEGKVTVAQRRSFSPHRDIVAAFSEPKPPISATLAQGQQIAYNASGKLEVVKRTDLEIATSWRDGRLQYRNELLKYVITDVNRYSSQQIVFGDRSAEKLVYTGTVFQGQIDDWLRGLQNIFPVEVVQTGSELILVRSREVH